LPFDKKDHHAMTETLSDLVSARFATTSQIGGNHPALGTHALQLQHRSVRHFTAKTVPAETLDLLFACAMSAPSKSDLQQTSIIHIDNADSRRQIAAALPSMPWVATAPVFLLFCGDSRRIRQICDRHHTQFAHDPLDALFNATTDTAMVLQNFILAAEAAGLGCCPISAVREITAEIAALTRLPDGVFPLAGLCVGYAAVKPPLSIRLPLAVTVHKDIYDDSDDAALIADYDKRRRSVNPYKTQRDVETFGQDAAYGWSTDKARQTAHTDRLAFSQHIHAHGFDL
jgi:nitroreductase